MESCAFRNGIPRMRNFHFLNWKRKNVWFFFRHNCTRKHARIQTQYQISRRWFNRTFLQYHSIFYHTNDRIIIFFRMLIQICGTYKILSKKIIIKPSSLTFSPRRKKYFRIKTPLQLFWSLCTHHSKSVWIFERKVWVVTGLFSLRLSRLRTNTTTTREVLSRRWRHLFIAHIMCVCVYASPRPTLDFRIIRRWHHSDDG